MAINKDLVASGDQVTVTRTNNTVDDANNTTDNIHTQYFPRIDTAMFHIVRVDSIGPVVYRASVASSNGGTAFNENTDISLGNSAPLILNAKILLQTTAYTVAHIDASARVNDITEGNITMALRLVSNNGGVLGTDSKIGTAFAANNVFETSNLSYDFSSDGVSPNDILSLILELHTHTGLGDYIEVKDISLYFA